MPAMGDQIVETARLVARWTNRKRSTATGPASGA